MFAISTHSANYERSMRILYLLQENEKIRTLLQYGVEDVDYEVGTLNGENVIYSKNSGYEMELLYTGNCYRTYPDYGVPMSYWDSIKEINLETECHPYMNLNIYLSSDKLLNEKLTDEQLATRDDLILALNGKNVTYWNEYLALTLSGFETSMKYDSVDKIDSDIKNATSKIKLTNSKYTRAENNYKNAETEEDKQKYLDEMNALQAEIDGYNETISILESVKPTLGSFLNAKSDISDIVEQLAAFYAGLPN